MFRAFTIVIKPFLLGFLCAIAVVVVLLVFMKAALAAPPLVLTQEATIGQQDRSLHVEVEPYDNSDFLRDMDAIANGTYVEPMEPEADAEEIYMEDGDVQ